MKKIVFLFFVFGWFGGLLAQDNMLPTVTIITDGPIVNTPAVHGIIRVDDHNGTVIEMDAGFKIRGTSSQQWDKKSYRVELWTDATGTEIADTAFLGMRSDDDWNLEAMYNQPLRLRNKVANELWRAIYTLPYLSTVPEASAGVDMEYVDVYVNGDYMGVYTLTERVDRKLLGLRKYNGNIRGVLYKGNGPGNASFETLPDYDNSSDEWDQFEWVYPNESDDIIDWSGLYGFVNFVINATDNVFFTQYSTMFEKDNAIDYYIFINAIGALDNMDRNTFIARYKKSSAYFYVPWDLDAIFGNTNEGEHDGSFDGLRSNGFFDRLVQDCSSDGFVAGVRERYNELRDGVLSVDYIMGLVQEQYEELVALGVYEHEHEAWPDYTVDASELDYIEEWLENRFEWLDDEFNTPCGTWSADEVEAPKAVEVFPNPANDWVTLRFAEPGKSTVRLYDMTGRLVYSLQSASQVITLPTQGLRKGVYSLLIQQQGKVFSERFILN